jgi:hypothetical protein
MNMGPISIVRLIFIAVLVLAPMAAAPAARAQGFTCTVSLGILEPFLSIGRLDFNLTYAPAEIVMVGSGAEVACSALASEIDGGAVPASFDDDDHGTVSGSLVSEAGFPGFTPLALCTLTASFEVEDSDFSAVATRVDMPDGEAIVPQPEILITGVDCASGTTTTTLAAPTTTTTTTTTLAAPTTTTTTTTTLAAPTTTLAAPTTTTTTTNHDYDAGRADHDYNHDHDAGCADYDHNDDYDNDRWRRNYYYHLGGPARMR